MSHPASSGPFAKLLDVRLVEEANDGSVTVAIDVREDHLRAGGIVHGGVMMTMLDVAMAASVGRTLKEGESTVSVNINTDFLRPAARGRLLAKGRLERRGATMAFPVGELRDGEGNLVARATGVWAIRTRKDER